MSNFVFMKWYLTCLFIQTNLYDIIVIKVVLDLKSQKHCLSREHRFLLPVGMHSAAFKL